MRSIPKTPIGSRSECCKFAPLPPARRDDTRLAMRAFGLNFPNPIGMAAGFDKNAEVPDALLRLGFGFVEVGTITPLPQAGQSAAARCSGSTPIAGVINRLGFNSRRRRSGAAAARRAAPTAAASSASISAPTRTRPIASPITCGLIERFAPVASYVTVNISSPNTPGLRDMQQAAVLDDLLGARDRCARARRAQRRTDAGAAQDRARPVAARSGRCGGHCALAPGRRHDCRQHHGDPVRRVCERPRSRKKRAACPDGRYCRWPTGCWRKPMCGSEGVFPADRRRRHRFRSERARQNPRRRNPHPNLFGIGVPRPWPVGEIKTALVGALDRDRVDDLRDYIGADAASVTAEPWPH